MKDLFPPWKCQECYHVNHWSRVYCTRCKVKDTVRTGETK